MVVLMGLCLSNRSLFISRLFQDIRDFLTLYLDLFICIRDLFNYCRDLLVNNRDLLEVCSCFPEIIFPLETNCSYMIVCFVWNFMQMVNLKRKLKTPESAWCDEK